MIELTDKIIGPKYRVLNPILELLLESGNEVFTDYTWSSNPTGYLCILKKPIDFDLIESRFVLPKSIHLNKRFGEVNYGLGTVIIRCALPYNKLFKSDSARMAFLLCVKFSV